ncbi:MAG: Fic family protein [Actinomycetia bacterium]|nr:Fic family protein [Actinomycetes bacterium]
MTRGSGWPACSTEERPWQPGDLEMIPRSRRARITGSYVATVTPHIADEPFVALPGPLAAGVAEAEAAIARFDERIGTSLASFTVIALRTEAATSSQIENLSAAPSSIAIAEHAAPSANPRKPNADLIAANVATLTVAMAGEGPLDVAQVIEIQRVLLEDSAPRLTGNFRNEQVWVGGDSYSPHGATHVAPHHERVPAAVDDLIHFANRQDLGALAHIAVTHAQFETIHPFADGNGRTGRAIIQRMLRNAGLTRQTILPLSAGLLADTERYFESLNTYRTGEIEPLVSAFVDATFSSLDNASRLAQDLAAVRDSWNGTLSARADSTVWPLLDYCIGRPAITARSVAADLGVSTVAAQNAIDRLAESGILRQNSPARRNRIWLVSEVLDSVDLFMERALHK